MRPRLATIFLTILCLSAGAALPAQSAQAAASSVQMLPPTLAGGSGSCGLSSSILTFDPAPQLGAAINCSDATLDPAGNFTTGGAGNFRNSLSVLTGAPSSNVIFTTDGRMMSGGPGLGGLWVDGAASTQFVGSVNATTMGLYNRAWNFTLDDSGNAVIAGKVSIQGQTASAATVSAANVLANISCPANTALTRLSDGSMNCIAVTDITGVGITTVPTCLSNQTLYFLNNQFVCVDSIGSCAVGMAVTGVSGGVLQCALLPAPPPTCTGSYVLHYSNGGYSCDLQLHGTQTFTSNGTFTVPSGVTAVSVTVIGGGGGGGGSTHCPSNNAVTQSGGYGGNSVVVNGVLSVTPGQQIGADIGAGGAGGGANCPGYDNGQSNPGSKGGSSSFGGLIAPGGNGGNGGAWVCRAGGNGGNNTGTNGTNASCSQASGSSCSQVSDPPTASSTVPGEGGAGGGGCSGGATGQSGQVTVSY